MRTLARLIFFPILALLISVPAALAEKDEEGFSQPELDQMLAPIALYPDALLSHILTASTYPLEIVSAARWSGDHPDLKGEEAVQAVADKDWDPSVKALVAFPKVLARMNDDLDWTTRLGDAFLYQQAQVTDTIQGLRQRAYKAGNLDSTGNLRVIHQEDVIVIESEHPRIIYVPYYNSRVIYGVWWWPAYPPVHWAPAPGLFLSAGFFFGSGVHVSLGFFYSTFDWHHHHVVVHHRPRHFHGAPRFKAGTRLKHHQRKWRHNPKHRRGVAYRHHSLQQKHGRSRASGGFHGRRSSVKSVHRSRGARFGHESAARSSPPTFVTARSDQRRAAGRARGRDFAADPAHRSRHAIPSGTRSAARSNSARSGRRGIGSRHGSRKHAAGVFRGPRTSGAVNPTRHIAGSRHSAATLGFKRGGVQSKFRSAKRGKRLGQHIAGSRRGAATRGLKRGGVQSKFRSAKRGIGPGRHIAGNRGGVSTRDFSHGGFRSGFRRGGRSMSFGRRGSRGGGSFRH